MIAGFIPPTSGKILLHGNCVNELPPEKREIGMVFQNYALFPHLTVSENVGYGLRLRKWPRKKIASSVMEKLDLVGLADYADRHPAQLSGGQKQRVALARAMAIEPQILLMDEPLTALDKKIRDELRIQLRQFQQDLKITTVFVTHDQVEALTMSDWIVLLNEGRVEQASPPEKLYESPESLFAARFIGENNEFAVKRVAPDLVDFNGFKWRINPKQAIDSSVEDCLAFVRPEQLQFDLSGNNQTDGIVEFIVVEDSLVRYKIRSLVNRDVHIELARTRHSRGASPKIGDKVTVSFDDSAIKLLEF
jgi:ABC-type Fe3+/spermidine/putrescine transport system ATPase subunit